MLRLDATASNVVFAELEARLPATRSVVKLSSGALGTLQRLNLNDNQIWDEGMKTFSTALSSGALDKLKHLQLESNRIGDEGMKAFSGALSTGSLGSLSNS